MLAESLAKRARFARTTGRGASAHLSVKRSLGTQLGLESLEERLALTALPAGFSETLVTTGSNLSSPTAMDFSPTGELWVLEQSGNVKLVRGDGTTHTAIDLAVDSSGERGLLGIAFAPNYDGAGPNQDFVYLYYTLGRTSATDPANNQVVRFTVSGAGSNTPTLTSPQMIREFPPEDEDNNPATDGDSNHNGGAIHFGPDGKLYVAIGDHNYDPPGAQQATHVAQQLNTPFGKMLRLNADGSNPTDNPFYTGSGSDWQGSIWGLGLRNPYTFAIDPADGRVFINDVGEGSWEEINVGAAGANFGWAGSNSPVWEGFENDGTPPPWANYRDPIMAYNHSSDPPTPSAVDITGGVFYPANSQFGAEFAGKYFFADAGAGFIRYFDPADPGTVAVPDTSSGFASSLTTSAPVDLKVDAAGNLYYLARGGEVHRISYTGDYGPSSVVGRQLFYNNSKFDGNGPGASVGDDAAIATNKSAYQAGAGLAEAQHVSSYSRGINGIMIDVAGNHGPLDVNDFTFRVGNNGSPGTWSAAPAPTIVSVRAGAGTAGSDRVVIIWPDGAIANTWLEVTVEGDDAAGEFNTSTGLDASDVFYFGSRIGDTFVNTPPAVFSTTAGDELGARANPGIEQPLTNIYDFDRNGVVSASDQLLARANAGLLVRLNLTGNSPAAEPAASKAGSDARRAAVASALALLMASPETENPATQLSLTSSAKAAAAAEAMVAVPGLLESEVEASFAFESHVEVDEPDELLAALLEW